PDPGTAFFTYFTCLVEAGTVNKALFEALATAGGQVDTTVLRAASGELLTALGDLLGAAQRAGAVRADVEPGDLQAMLAGALAMERAGAGPPGRMIAIVCDGLRAAPPH
ncbi:MAG TPA: TetR/AcrR family transcriptional regulator, partial [Micromonosporaceae bacterium]|nr:TetR/AcrR family transcriptional regulator [Micromonosporaceae bacterium]